MQQFIKATVRAGAKRETIARKKKGDAFAICVREPAEAGKANLRVRELLARELAVPVARIRIVTGHRSPSKLLAVQ